MDDAGHLPYLRSLLYRVRYRPHPEVASADFARQFKDAYTADEYARFVEGLEWAAVNPTYDFASLLPAPGAGPSSGEIYETFLRVLASLKAC